MITLPLATSGAKVSPTTSSAASASADVTADTAASEVSASSEGENAGFVTLLGKKLLSLAQQGETAQASLTTVTTPATAAADKSDAAKPQKSTLSALLAAADKPETLSALLQPVKGDTTLKREDSSAQEAPAAELNASDMQALQALFAMLPPAAVQQPAAAAKNAGSLTDESAINGAKMAPLSALLSTAKSVEGGSSKSSVKTEPLTTAAGNASSNATPETPALTAAIQQALGNGEKSSEKENSGSAPAATITNNVISAASSLVTPTTNSMVVAPASAQLSSQLGSDEWQQALGQQILLFSKNGQQSAELHLHPQDLGSIQISLKLESDQAQLSMVSNHSQVRAALEAAMPQLRTALAENGISLGQSNVSSDAFQQGQSFSGQQQQQRNNSGGNTFSPVAENEAVPIAVPAALQARAAGTSAVDIFA